MKSKDYLTVRFWKFSTALCMKSDLTVKRHKHKFTIQLTFQTKETHYNIEINVLKMLFSNLITEKHLKLC